ncbi:MAG: EscU/YscU/HrcU family type III secretion system export apparatus switch protein [Clostridiales Family XIII bacterium]|jgi:flagellar biosynthesis protein|nr:EscU/YscU/HrcU family type III secretion system export apparatus switch protein [Clostridiales Family XIII bacterium]
MSGSKDAAGGRKGDGLNVAALRYDPEQDRAPHVVAAGSGYVAQKILQIAIENGISIYHDDSAATMLAKLDVGKEIPPELYQIVVNIYISLLDTADRRHSPEKYLAKAERDAGDLAREASEGPPQEAAEGPEQP